MKSYFSTIAITLFSLSAISAPQTLPVDTGSAKVNWKAGKEIGSNHTGTMKLKSGEVQVEKDKLVSGTFVIDMKTIEITDIPSTDENNAKLKGHLNSPDFFDTKKNETATLKIKEVKYTKQDQADVTGDLTIKGQTQPITFPVSFTKQTGYSRATGKLNVDRTKYGIKYGTKDLAGKLGADKIIKNIFEIDFDVATTTPVKTK